MENMDANTAAAFCKMGTQVANIAVIDADTDTKMNHVRERAEKLSGKVAKLKAVVSSCTEQATKLAAKEEKAKADEAAKREANATAAQELAKRTQERLKLEARLRRLEAELAALQEEASVYEDRIRELEGDVATARGDLEAAQTAEREALAARDAAEAELKAAESALESATADVLTAEMDLWEAQLSLKVAEEELASKEEVLDVLYNERADALNAHNEAVVQARRLEAEVKIAQQVMKTFAMMKAAATAAAMALSATVVGASAGAAILATLTAMENMYQQQLQTASERLALASKESHERDAALQQLNARVECAEKEREEATTTREMRNQHFMHVRALLDSKQHQRVLAEERVTVSASAFGTAVRNHSRAAATVKIHALDLDTVVASLQEIREKISAKENEIRDVTDNLLAVANNAEQDLRRDRQHQWNSVSSATLARVQVARELAKTTTRRDAAKFNLDATSMAMDQAPAHLAALKSLKDKVTEAKDKVTQEQMDLIKQAREKAAEHAKAKKQEEENNDAGQQVKNKVPEPEAA